MDTFVRNEIYNKNKRIHKSVRSYDELIRNKNIMDQTRIKQIKAFRNEVSLKDKKLLIKVQ